MCLNASNHLNPGNLCLQLYLFLNSLLFKKYRKQSLDTMSKSILVLDTEQNAGVEVMTLDTKMETTATAILCTV